MTSRHEASSESGRPGSISRRELLRRVALGLGAAALVGAEPALASPIVVAEQPTVARWTAPTTVRQGPGTITVYSALNESTNNAFIEAYKTATPGADVQLLPLAAAGELATRIRTERNSPKADVFIGGPSENHINLIKDDLLEPYFSPNAAAIDPAYKDPDGYWTGWYLGIFGVVINKDRWAAEMGDAAKPATWEDLLDPVYQGKLNMPDPVKTGGGFLVLATQVFRFDRDEEKALEYMKALHANIGQYVGTAPQGIELVAQGQFLAGPNWGHDILTAANRGHPIEFVAPAPTGNEVGGISIIKGGPNTEGAKTFVDWVLTPEASALNVSLSNRLSVLPNVPPAPGAPTLDQVSLVAYDAIWAGQNKDRLIRAWQTAVGL
jgi:iron(III) transport system substrate-binding protein